MTKKNCDLTPEQIARNKALGLARREKNRDEINERQRAKRAELKEIRARENPPPSEEELAQRARNRALASAEYKKRWREQNIDRVRAKRKEKYESDKEQAIKSAVLWNRANPDRRREISARYEANNPENRRIAKARRRTRERNADGEFTSHDLRQIIARQRGRCAACGGHLGKDYEADHIVPLALGGTSWPENIQALCRSCNRRKGAKHPVDFAREIGRLI